MENSSCTRQLTISTGPTKTRNGSARTPTIFKHAETKDNMLEFINIRGTTLNTSPIALGTWAIGGWMWGGSDERESIRTIHAALDQGINLIDTAPIYGNGRSEEIVGKAL